MISNRQIYTVSKLTDDIRFLLEKQFSFIWVTGEISNIHFPASGHCYFTLKDENAQISSVMFRNQNRLLRFRPEDGMHVTGLGRISVYAPRGAYQIIFEQIEPKGLGALQAAFEQLKARLSAEGLFDEAYKKPIPVIPKRIVIITSPTGAVIHDILNIINRRFPNVYIRVIPVRVQGHGADLEISDAIELLNTMSDTSDSESLADVAILARGGGSLEDLQAFNSETVARAIFASRIPIISAVGHETDFTIADFTADLRAPTPSAAAELIVPVKTDLIQTCRQISTALLNGFFRYIERRRNQAHDFSKRLLHPQKNIQDARLKIDDYAGRLCRAFTKELRQKREHLAWRIQRLYANTPEIRIQKSAEMLELRQNALFQNFRIYFNQKTARFRELSTALNALNPIAILSRGYSVARTIPDRAVIRDAKSVSKGQVIEIVLANGAIKCRVEDK